MRPDPLIDSVLGPEAILPSQFFRRAAAASPETRLMLAILERALLDLRSSTSRRTSRTRRLVNGVDAWFAADDEGWPFSFANICHGLGLDAAAIRSRLRTDARAQVVALRIARRDRPAMSRKIAAAG